MDRSLRPPRPTAAAALCSALALRAALAGTSAFVALLVGCGGDPAAPDAAADAADGDNDTLDAGAADAAADGDGDGGPPLTLKWTATAAPLQAKALAGAAVPGKPGHYVIVGEEGGVALLSPTGFTSQAIAGAGSADLEAVWIDADGTVVVGGGQSILATGSGEEWQLVPAIPPSPPTRFRAIDGAGGVVWAVGSDGAAWRRDDKGVWLAEAVSVTEGVAGAPAEALPADYDFTAVAVGAAGAAVTLGVDLGNDGGALLDKVAGGWRRVPLPVAPTQLWRAPGGAVYVVGGVLEPFVARWVGGALQVLGETKWTLGFRSVRGVADDDVLLGGLKGQLRRYDGKAFAVVDVAPPIGTPKPFPAPSGDVVGLASHAADELLVITPFFLYRYGRQP